MNLNLKEKVIIVTGGAKGIGAAIVKELASEGAIPVIAGRSPEVGQKLADEIAAQSGKCLVLEAELSKSEEVQQVVTATLDTFGTIHGIVNNAGVNDGVGIINGSPQKFRNSINTNLHHYFELVHFSVHELIKNKGSIVNISSKTAITGQGGTSGYAASNGAQLSLTREWAVELAPHGVRVNAIVPAEVMTPQYQRWINSLDDGVHTLDNITSRIPLGKRMTTSEEIAAMTVFLLSDKSSHTTGQWLYVDGGYVHLDRAIS